MNSISTNFNNFVAGIATKELVEKKKAEQKMKKVRKIGNGPGGWADEYVSMDVGRVSFLDDIFQNGHIGGTRTPY